MENAASLAKGAFLRAVEGCHPRALLPASYRELAAAVPGLLDARPAVISIGKASLAMRDALASLTPLSSSIVVTKDEADPNGEALYGGHPRPTQASLEAGEAVWKFASSLPNDQPVIGLISGGASALCEHLREGFHLSDALELVNRSFAEGWPIEQLNAERQKISALKLGGLADLLGPRLAGVIALSDVGGESPDRILGSGPFFTGGKSPFLVAGDRWTAARLAADTLERSGIRVKAQMEMAGEAREFAAAVLAPQAEALAPGEALVWCGETVATVRGPGLGGRCQEIMCAVSRSIADWGGLAILAAGTDGTDGPTDAAGALLTGALARSAPDPSRFLVESNSHEWCRLAEALIVTGSTSTNVNDIGVAVRA